MAMGSALLRPQSLTVTVTRDDEIVLALTDLAEALARDPETSAAVVQMAIEELSQGMRDFVLSFEEPLRFAEADVRSLFASYGDVVGAFVGGIDDSALASLPAFLDALRGGLTLLSTEQVVSLVEGILAIAEEGLGLTAERVAGVATGIAGRIEDRAMAPFLAGGDDRRALALYDIGSCLARLRSLLGELETPSLDFDFLVSGLRARFATTGVDRVVQLLGELLDAIEDVLEASGEIVGMLSDLDVEVEGSVHVEAGGSVGAAAAADGPSGPADAVAWYASWVAGEKVRYPTDTALAVNVYDNEWLRGFGYKLVSREKMETIARVTAWAEKALDAALHLMSAEQGDVLSNLGHAGIDGVDVGLKIGGIKLPGWAYWCEGLVSTFALGFEGYRGSDSYWLTNSAGRAGEVILYRRWTWMLREALLSTLTLLNNDPQAFAAYRSSAGLDAAAAQSALERHNNNCIEGVSYAVAELGGLLLPAILSETDRADYGLIDKTLPPAAIGKAFAGSAVSWGFLYLSVFLTRLLAGEWPTHWPRYGRLFLYDRIFGRFRTDSTPWKIWSVARAIGAVLSGPLFQMVYLYLFTNGNTDGGQYALDGNFGEARYLGYPERSASPYLLPYESGKTFQCVQGNLGPWSHYPRWTGGNEMYSFDFSHDLGDEVLCSRLGIVIRAQDSTPDNGSPWNLVEVMHLVVDPTGATGQPAAPATQTMFSDGTLIPPGTLFPPYPTAGFPLANVPLHPTATAAAFPPNATFSFVDPLVDRGAAGITFPAGTAFSDGTPIPPGTVFPPGTPLPPPPGVGFTAGTTFVPQRIGTAGFLPLRATFASYGHGRQGFLTTIFGTTQVLGRLVPAGRLIMLADSTGNSAYNHLHVHVQAEPSASAETAASIPFVYSDVRHTISNGVWKGIFYPSDGRPRPMTYYTSTNVKVTTP